VSAARRLPAADLVLHMFPASHFNEKARWGLDWKGLPHARVAYLPGPHGPQLRRLSGQAQTPVLVMRGRVIPGSARILDELERAFPQRPLYPEETRRPASGPSPSRRASTPRSAPPPAPRSSRC